MRVLLDENLPHKLRQLFEDNIEVVTVDYQGWKGKENGDLLSMAAVEFDAFITMDRSIPNQHNLTDIMVKIVITNTFE